MTCPQSSLHYATLKWAEIGLLMSTHSLKALLREISAIAKILASSSHQSN
jgi:hypothetical protein